MSSWKDFDPTSVNIGDGWKQFYRKQLGSIYFKEAMKKLSEAIKDKEDKVFPPRDLVFNAFNLTPLNNVKVVLLGQDPYHSAPPIQAHGLSFSVPKGIKVPPSLVNIYKELIDDPEIQFEGPGHGELTSWARDGVLLLNASLSVEKSSPGSHMKYWEDFTDNVIKYVSTERDHVVFLLFGNFAKSKSRLIDNKKHHIITATHPSPLGANKGGWFGSRVFSRANRYLREHGIKEITWQNK